MRAINWPPGEIRAAVLAAGYDLIVEEAHKEERQEEETTLGVIFV